MEKYYVYKYYIENTLIYVGRTNNYIVRFKQHLKENKEYDKVTSIHIATFDSDGDMMLYEKYYITKLHPPFNSVDMQFSKPTITLPEPEWKIYNKEDFNQWLNIKQPPKVKIIKIQNQPPKIIKNEDIIELPNEISFEWLLKNYNKNKQFIYKDNLINFYPLSKHYSLDFVFAFWDSLFNKKTWTLKCNTLELDTPQASLEIISQNGKKIKYCSLTWYNCEKENNEIIFTPNYNLCKIITKKGTLCFNTVVD